MTTTYCKADFYKYVAPHVYGVSEPAVEGAVEDVIIDFCNRTSFYRRWLEDYISVAIGDEEVDLDLPRNTAVVDVIAIQKVDDGGEYGEFLDPDSYLFSNQTMKEAGTTDLYDNTSKILFNEPSDEGYEARVRLALRPIVGFTEVPNWVYEDWREVIVHGVLSRLLSMRSKAWYALTESEQHRNWYMAGVRKAANKVVLETINKVSKPVSRYI
jgi:hypothetical protein